MISIKDTIINDTGISESTKNDINKILFRDINYCHKKLEDGFISRDVNYYQDNNEDNSNVFYKINYKGQKVHRIEINIANFIVRPKKVQ